MIEDLMAFKIQFPRFIKKEVNYLPFYQFYEGVHLKTYNNTLPKY